MSIRKRYKIKEFSEEMGVTIDLVKHYEKYGIIKPIKEDECKYRFYTIQHGERILASKRFRNMGFTIRESAKIMNEYSLNEIQSTLCDKADEIEKEIKKLQSMQKRVAALNEQCTLFRKSRDRGIITMSPGFYYINQVKNAEFHQDEITKNRIKEWIEQFPFVTKAAIVQSYHSSKENELSCDWGLSIDEETAKNIDIDCSYPVRYIKPRKCYKYVVAEPYNGPIINYIGKFIRMVEEQSFKVDGDIFLEAGIDSFNEYINGREVHYIFWIPIQ